MSPSAQRAPTECRAILAAARLRFAHHDRALSARWSGAGNFMPGEAPRPIPVVVQCPSTPESGPAPLRNASPRPWPWRLGPAAAGGQRRAGGSRRLFALIMTFWGPRRCPELSALTVFYSHSLAIRVPHQISSVAGEPRVSAPRLPGTRAGSDYPGALARGRDDVSERRRPHTGRPRPTRLRRRPI